MRLGTPPAAKSPEKRAMLGMGARPLPSLPPSPDSPMARSLTVQHEENPSTNPLLTGFLLLAAAVLMASALLGAPAVNAEVTPAQDTPALQ